MLKGISAIASLSIALVTTLGLNSQAIQSASAQETRTQELTLPNLTPALQTALCQSQWPQALRLTNALIANPTSSSEYREQLVNFRYQLQEWRAANATIANLPGCRELVLRVRGNAAQTATPLNFGAALRSLNEGRALRNGSIGYQGLPQVEPTQAGCWVTDTNGRRFDLSSLCGDR